MIIFKLKFILMYFLKVTFEKKIKYFFIYLKYLFINL